MIIYVFSAMINPDPRFFITWGSFDIFFTIGKQKI